MHARALIYPPDPRCARQRGYHHGIDIAMKCGAQALSPMCAEGSRHVGEQDLLDPPTGPRLSVFAPRVATTSSGTSGVLTSAQENVFVQATSSRAPDSAGRPMVATCTSRFAPKAAPYTRAVPPRQLLQLSRRPQLHRWGCALLGLRTEDFMSHSQEQHPSLCSGYSSNSPDRGGARRAEGVSTYPP